MVTSKEIFQITKRVNPAVREGEELITSGILNSIEIVALVVELESEYGIRISPIDIDVDHFNTLSSIANLVNLYLNDEEQIETKASVLNIDVDSLMKSSESEENEQGSARSMQIQAKRSFEDIIGQDEEEDLGESDFKYPENAHSVVDFLKNAAAQSPEKTAVSDPYGNQLSFRELEEKSDLVGAYLHEKYGCANRPFAVIARRNVRSLIMFLGIIKSGNYYIPVDEDLPFSQMEEHINLVNPEAVLWHYNARKDEVFDLDAEIEIYDEILEAEEDPAVLQGILDDITYDTPLYGIFTSGTTGKAKCVVKSHGAMVSFIRDYIRLFGFSHRDVLGCKLSLMFDAFTKDLYTCLYCGAHMYLMPMGSVLPTEDAAFLQEAGVTSAVWTPSMLRNFIRLHILENYPLPALKRILFVGEALEPRYMNAWLSGHPDCLYVNLYGTTEMTGNCLYGIIKEPVTGDTLPLTHVFPGYEVFLSDENGNEITSPGQVGEICASGSLLMTEQLGEQPKEAASDTAHTGKRVWHSGDMAVRDESGTWFFASRSESYFKHAGYRISPAQVESAFQNLDFVEQVVCMYDAAGERITLFWQGDSGREQELYNAAEDRLASYMLPGKYIHLESFPLNHNGKVNLTALHEKLG